MAYLQIPVKHFDLERLVRKRGEWGRKVIQGTGSQAGARAWWSLSREEWEGWWRLGIETEAAGRQCLQGYLSLPVAGVAGQEGSSACVAYPMGNSQICIRSG